MAAKERARTHIRLLGLDPGLVKTGWGIVDSDGVRLSHVACGTVRTDSTDETSARLATLYEGLTAIIGEWRPDAAAVEETFVNRNPASALKLGLARGVVISRRRKPASRSPSITTVRSRSQWSAPVARAKSRLG